MDAIKTLVALACVNAQVGMEVAQLVSRLRSFKLPRKVAQLSGLSKQGRITTCLTQLSEALTKGPPALIIAPMFRVG
ncbi:hypothetical protein F442_22426 [Phytophthora nicotianae P10297]|uniref:Uncharacterized protein n=1 Tax=Phytophthora nicotianae P10297 TaxID=1317064 RepID=W2Y267_PHYNI|nr:hypothetical protein F442_22426 [Phytophthora nicotianae P10297]